MSDSSLYRLAVQFIERYQTSLAQRIWQQADTLSQAIITSHEDASRSFWLTVIHDPDMQIAERKFLEDSGVKWYDQDPTSPQNAGNNHEKFIAHCISFTTIIFTRWQYRFFFNRELIALDIEEVIEHLLGRVPSAERIAGWFIVARQQFFATCPDEEMLAKANGWYTWASDTRTAAEYIGSAYCDIDPYHWMWDQLVGLRDIYWQQRGDVA